MSKYHIFLAHFDGQNQTGINEIFDFTMKCLVWSRAGLNQIRKRELQAAFLLWNYKGFKSAPAHI